MIRAGAVVLAALAATPAPGQPTDGSDRVVDAFRLSHAILSGDFPTLGVTLDGCALTLERDYDDPGFTMSDRVWLGDLALDAPFPVIAERDSFVMVSIGLSEPAKTALVPAYWRLMEGDPAARPDDTAVLAAWQGHSFYGMDFLYPALMSSADQAAHDTAWDAVLTEPGGDVAQRTHWVWIDTTETGERRTFRHPGVALDVMLPAADAELVRASMAAVTAAHCPG